MYLKKIRIRTLKNMKKDPINVNGLNVFDTITSIRNAPIKSVILRNAHLVEFNSATILNKIFFPI